MTAETSSKSGRHPDFAPRGSCQPSVEQLLESFLSVRRLSVQLCQPLLIEDYGLQAMDSTSPAKWHLAHTTWFFETFILKPYCSDYQVFHPKFEYLFNSYYNGIGAQFPRSQRALLSRPSVEDVSRYREHVDAAMQKTLASATAKSMASITERIILGCHHEQQHQELFFTDLKYCWFQNPIFPSYCEQPLTIASSLEPIDWLDVRGGLHKIGHADQDAFSFDNELPRHQHYLEDFRIADRLVSNGEYMDFMRDGGYQRSELWLADGWAELKERSLVESPLRPLYWIPDGDDWMEYSLHGLAAVDPHRPACHLSAYEADAYARWAGARLPTEFEWEISVNSPPETNNAHSDDAGQFLTTESVHPAFGSNANPSDNVLGRLWQWTSSAYSPYPGYKPAESALGEYNGKFMSNQLVLRGGSCVTHRSHYRHSYRNFFYPPDRWQFTGIRLAQVS